MLITNVPGPQVPLYAAGERLVASYPVLPLEAGHLLAIGVTSYDGQVFFGLTADRDALSDLDVLAQCLLDAVEELLDTTVRAGGFRQPTRKASRGGKTGGREEGRGAAGSGATGGRSAAGGRTQPGQPGRRAARCRRSRRRPSRPAAKTPAGQEVPAKTSAAKKAAKKAPTAKKPRRRRPRPEGRATAKKAAARSLRPRSPPRRPTPDEPADLPARSPCDAAGPSATVASGSAWLRVTRASPRPAGRTRTTPPPTDSSTPHSTSAGIAELVDPSATDPLRLVLAAEVPTERSCTIATAAEPVSRYGRPAGLGSGASPLFADEPGGRAACRRRGPDRRSDAGRTCPRRSPQSMASCSSAMTCCGTPPRSSTTCRDDHATCRWFRAD